MVVNEIRVRPATPADADDILRIYTAAFGPGVMNRLMYSCRGMSAEGKKKYAASLFPRPDPESTPTSAEQIVMVAELPPETGAGPARVVAYSKWIAYRQPRPESEWNVKKEATVDTLGPDIDFAVYNTFIGGLHAMRNRHARGDPAFCAASALLRWGVAEADRSHLPLWLEASPQGYPLYRRFDFEAKDKLDLDLAALYGVTSDGTEDWGANSAPERLGSKPASAFRTVLMKREPRA